MSKVVKKVGKAVSSVTRSVTKVVKGAVSVVKKVASSKLGKILITAAAIYFGGAALAGGFSSSAAGGSFLSGMGTGVANAATSLQTAWGSAMAGEFSSAGSALSSGFQGQVAGGAANATTNAAVSGIDLGGAGSSPANMGSVSGATNVAVTPPVTPPVAPPPAAPMSVGEGLMGAAKIQAGTAIIGGAMQGKGQQDAMEDQRAYDEKMAAEARMRYGQNVGTQLWSGDPSQQQTYSGPGAFTYDPQADARAINESRMQRPGLISRAQYGAAPYRYQG